jgi:hypothetical protein
MPTFPDSPVSPRDFIEDVVPSLFAEADLDEAEEAIDLKVGVVLRGTPGDEGGEWTLHRA